MRGKFKESVHSLVPPILWRGARTVVSRVRGSDIRFMGDYSTWAEARAASTGYEAADILTRAVEAARKVKRGEAAFERDGVAYGRMEYHFPLAWALMRAAARHGRLHVLDFGGALGSAYFQARPLIDAVPDVRWAVVEQAAYVAAGTQECGNDELSFHDTIDAARHCAAWDVLLLSSVLQYLPDPFAFLESVMTLKFPAIILDRTPFMADGRARLTVQRVPEWIGPASYPAWFFSEPQVLAKFSAQYDSIASWPALDDLHPEEGRAMYKGFLFESKTV